MKKTILTIVKSIIFILLLFFIISYVTKCNETIDNNLSIQDIMPPKITRLTKSVLGTMRYEIKDHNISDDDLIKEATKQDPDLIKPFQNYALIMKRTKRNLILMVGPKNKEYCMFQDYSWSDHLDFNYLKTGEKIPFEITAEVPIN